MSSYFEPKKEDLKIDEFVSVMDKLAHWVITYQIPIIVFIAIGCLSLVGALVLKNKKEANLNQQQLQIYSALKDSNPTAALETLNNKLTDSPLNYVVELKLAQKYLVEKNNIKALEALSAAKKSAPDFLIPMISLSAAQLLWQDNKIDDALALLETIKSDVLVGPQSLYVKALILKGQGKTEEAKAVLTSLVSTAEKDSMVSKQAEASLNAMLIAELK